MMWHTHSQRVACTILPRYRAGSMRRSTNLDAKESIPSAACSLDTSSLGADGAIIATGYQEPHRHSAGYGCLVAHSPKKSSNYQEVR